MTYLNLKEREEAERTRNFAFCLKEFVKTQDENEIRLWDATEGGVVAGCYLVDDFERGFVLDVTMNGCGQFVMLPKKTLVEACAAFNTILQTMNA